MDNLAHALTAAATAHLASPKSVPKSFSKRLMWVSAVVCNLPDVDVALSVLGAETYHFHHRGFTHSIAGLLLLLPFSYFVFRKLMGAGFWSRDDAWNKSQALYYVAFQLCFTHYFLDYLTTYGTMFLYPFSFARFSYPLMFIIDPLFWAVTLLGTTTAVLASNRSRKTLRNVSIGASLGICALWAWEVSYKWDAERIVAKRQPHAKLYSYPGVGAPALWSVVAVEDETVAQFVIGRLPNREIKVTEMNMREDTRYNELCKNLDYGNIAEFDFHRYIRFAEHSACTPTAKGCRCLGLKYSLLGEPDASLFGTFEFYPNQPGKMIQRGDPANLWQAMERLLPR